MLDLCNVRNVRDIMAMFGISFRKEFGQNFLIDPSVVEDIAASASDRRETTVLEIGPGIGTLTRQLAERYDRVIAVEIDRGLIPVLRYTLSDCPPDTVTVICDDIMKTDIRALTNDAFSKGPVSVCANLPYYITTPILMKLLESDLPFETVTVMVQLEVADRLCASPGRSDYGAITAVLNYYGTAERLFRVSASQFVPPPKVDSAVVRIRLHKQKPVCPDSPALMFDTIRHAFEHRRKTLVNALSSGFPQIPKQDLTDIIVSLGFPADIRGERLSTADFAALSDRIGQALPQRASK